MDPVTVGAIGGILQLFEQYGFPAVGVVLVFFAARGVTQILRAWRDGLFFPKSYMDQVLALKDERLKEVQDRYAASQSAVNAWRQNNEATLKIAEQAQERQKQVMDSVANLSRELAAAILTIRKDLEGVQGQLDALREERRRERDVFDQRDRYRRPAEER